MSQCDLDTDKDKDAAMPVGEPVVRVVAMPADTNANGDVFGGWLFGRMDQAGGIVGVRRSRGRVVTVAVQEMSFIAPLDVGDVLSVYTDITRIGRTSMTIAIQAWKESFLTRVNGQVARATFVFVAIDDDGKPRVVPPEESLPQ